MERRHNALFDKSFGKRLETPTENQNKEAKTAKTTFPNASADNPKETKNNACFIFQKQRDRSSLIIPGVGDGASDRRAVRRKKSPTSLFYAPRTLDWRRIFDV
jgi:hypothetical protein